MNHSGTVSALPILSWVFAAVLLLLVVVSMLAARGILRRNHILGIRIPALFASDDAWQRGHSAAVRPSWIGFIVAVVAAVVGIFVPVVYWVAIAAFVITAIWSILAASRAAHTTREGA